MKELISRVFTVAAMVSVPSLAVAQESDWRTAAEERIRDLRTSDVWLQLVDENGNKLPAGTDAQVRMTRSAFNFGTAMASWKLEQLGEDHPYFQKPLELFNTIVLENNHKWSRWADAENRAHAERLVAWAREHRFAIRGHGFFWGMKKHAVIPEPMLTAIRNDEPGMEERLIEGAHAHILELGSALPFVYEWDVINEPVMEQVAMKYIGANTLEEQAEYLAEMFRTADKAAPQASLVMNEYHILAGPRAHERLLALAKKVRELGGPIDGVGFQNHWFHSDMRRDPQEIFEQMNEYSDAGFTISITEFDTLWGPWGEDEGRDKEEVKAEWLETILTLAYSHPAVSSFLLWGFWDGQHWNGNASLYHQDWTPKPGLDVWKRLVLGEWRTDEGVRVSPNGSVNFHAHHGLHEVTATVNGREYRGEINIGPQTKAERVVLSPQ